jgi:hypothetical protein
VELAVLLIGIIIWGITSLLSTTPATERSATESTIYPAVAAVNIATDRGIITITAENRSDIAVVINMRTRGKLPRREAGIAKDELSVQGHCGSFFRTPADCEISFELRVPVTTMVTAHSDRGRIWLVGTTGDADLSSDEGDITTRDIRGDQKLSSDRGSLVARNAQGDRLRLATKSGDIDINALRAAHRIDATTRKGGVLVVVPRRELYRLDAGSQAAAVIIGVDPTPTSAFSIVARSDDGQVTVRGYP